MKKLKIYNIILIFVALISIFSYMNRVEASSIGLYVPTTSITVGNSITVTVTGDDAIGRVDVYSSNSNIASVSNSSLWIEGSASFTITAKAVGSATITISPSDMSNGAGETASVGAKSITIYSQAVYVDNRSKNNDLSSITVDGYELDFNKDNTSYAIEVENDVTKLNVSASTEDYKATLHIENPDELVVGDNYVKINVTAENQSVKTYEIKVYRKKNPEDINANLKSLRVLNAGIKNIFSSDTVEYLCEDITADVDNLEIEYETEIEGAKVEILGNENLEQGINHVKVKVTSKDESVEKEYDIIVFKSNQMAALIEVEEEEPINIITWLKANKIVALCLAVILILIIVIIILLIRNSKKGIVDEDLIEEETEVKKHRRNTGAINQDDVVEKVSESEEVSEEQEVEEGNNEQDDLEEEEGTDKSEEESIADEISEIEDKKDIE